MYTKDLAIQEVITSLRKALGKGFVVNVEMLETPPDSKLGDVAFPTFELAKGEGRNPAEIATELAAKIGPSTYIEKITATGPYVNFTFATEALAEDVLKQIKKLKASYGNSKTGEGKKVLVEYAQPNTHKEFHIGHVRNAVLGQAVANVMIANGYKTVAVSFINDLGANVAKVLWGLKKFMDEEEIKAIAKDDRAKVLGEIYIKATQFVEKEEVKASASGGRSNAKEEISDVLKKLEAREEPWNSLWKETREWSLDEFRKIFKELNVRPDVWYFEHEVEEAGKDIVNKMLTNGIAKKSEGAVVVDLESDELPPYLVLKSDGTSLYSTKDLALAFKKEEDHHPDRQIFVVDVRQSLYFQQLFATLKKLGFRKKLTHLAYDMVNLPDGTMSSRSGNIVRYADVRDTMTDKLRDETKNRHEEWSDKQVEQTARVIALSGMVFMMLRQDPKSIITFDMDEALSFDGFTGPYMLYNIARIESIKKKAEMKPKADAKKLTHELESALLRRLADYPDVIRNVGANFQISSIAQWSFDTAKMFAEYYHEVRVIDEEDKETSQARLALIDGVQQVLTNSMNILGIDVLHEM